MVAASGAVNADASRIYRVVSLFLKFVSCQ